MNHNSITSSHRVTSTRLGNLNPVFRKRPKSEDNKELTKATMKDARQTGVLNLAGRGLASVPDQVFEINQSDADVEVTLESLVAKEEDAWWNQVPLDSLDLSSNALSTLSPNIYKLSSLTVLMLHNNALTSIPKEIGRLEKLTRVNLSRNKLKCLPLEFYTLPQLRCLNLSYNHIEEIDPAISDLHMLEFLDLSNNKLTSLPCGIGFLVRTKELLLSHNHLKDLPADLVDMRCLAKLDLTHNDLSSLPANMGTLRKLQYLYLQHNDISDCPVIEGCVDLQELYLANNFISELPENFFINLPHLKILDLRDNKIEQIPDDILYLQGLTRLDLTNNSITNLPTTLASLAHLVSLQVEGNPIKAIRRDILQCGTARILKTLRDRAENTESAALETASFTALNIVMAGDGLNSPRPRKPTTTTGNTGFPDKYKMRKSRCLNVAMQNIEEIPDAIFQTAMEENVGICDFSKNRLKSMPIGLMRMSACCVELTFANNLINSVPTFLSQFTRLSLLNLSCNNIEDLPKEFGLLTTMRELNISNNRFEKIPNCIYELTNLEILLAANNRIRYIDATNNGLGALPRLANLNLRNNNIEQVPPILGNLKNITNLDIIGNPFRQPRHQVIEKGTEAIMSYLRDRIPV